MGGKEYYTVTDSNFYEKFAELEAHYQLKVRKDNSLPRREYGISHINIHGNNNRFNVNSIDNSCNIIKNYGPLTEQIDQLKKAVESLGNDVDDKNELMEIVEDIRIKSLVSKPNKRLIKALLDSLPTVDIILSIGVNIMQLLG